MTQQQKTGRGFTKEQQVDIMVNKAKGEVIAEFEKVCSTDRSFERMMREMHFIFDQLTKEIKQL